MALKVNESQLTKNCDSQHCSKTRFHVGFLLLKRPYVKIYSLIYLKPFDFSGKTHLVLRVGFRSAEIQ